MSVQYIGGARDLYRAISPRLAINTEVSALAGGALVELKRAPLAAMSWRER